MRSFLVSLMLFLLLWSCARVGSPVGGPKDTTPPKVTGSNIDSSRVNVPTSLKRLRIEFDEYITLKEAVKNITVSPPLSKIKKILPANLATEFLQIEWEDDLQPNTTYNFNFGNAIQDHNEGNELPYYNFAFSTGPKLDELYISGEVTDGSSIKVNENSKKRVVALYKEADSINYSQKPYYLTRADDDGYYELNYLAPGKYRIIAFEDLNGNSIYDPGTEKISFQKEAVTLEKSISGLNLPLSPSRKPVKYKEGKVMDGGALLIFEGNPEKVELISKSDKLKDFKITHKTHSDSVRVWFDAQAQNIGINSTERLDFEYNADGKKGTSTVFYKKPDKQDMTLQNRITAKLAPQSPFKVGSNYLITNINTQNWTLKEDSLTTVQFEAKLSEENRNDILISADFKESKKYQLYIPKGSVSSYYANNANSYRFDFQTDQIQNFGSIEITLINKPKSKFWIQLLSPDEAVQYQKYTDQDKIKFNFVKPETYIARILVDSNGNGNWDLADFAEGTSAEPAYIFYKVLSARPLWEIREDWDLKSAQKLDLNSIPKITPPTVKAESTETDLPAEPQLR